MDSLLESGSKAKQKKRLEMEIQIIYHNNESLRLYTLMVNIILLQM
jgi:hypothetical protein